MSVTLGALSHAVCHNWCCVISHPGLCPSHPFSFPTLSVTPSVVAMLFVSPGVLTPAVCHSPCYVPLRPCCTPLLWCRAHAIYHTSALSPCCLSHSVSLGTRRCQCDPCCRLHPWCRVFLSRPVSFSVFVVSHAICHNQCLVSLTRCCVPMLYTQFVSPCTRCCAALLLITPITPGVVPPCC